MRHRKSGRKLNRTSSHRQAMFRNMAVSLLRHEQIETTLPKAKELRRVAEPLITLAKTASIANRRLAYARLRDRAVVGKLFDDLGARFKDRPGGYVRILKMGYRHGDAAPRAIVQLVERAAAVEAGGEAGTKGTSESTSKRAKKAVSKKEAKATKKTKSASTARKKKAGRSKAKEEEKSG